MTRPRNILNRFNKKDRLDILTIPADERFNIYLAESGHNFWYFGYEWNDKYGSQPLNFKPLQTTKTGIVAPSWLDFDLVLCQNEPFHEKALAKYSETIGIPLISFNIYENNYVDTVLFENKGLKREQFALLIYDNWAKKTKTHGYYIWEKLRQYIPTVVFGKNPGMTREPANVDELVYLYNTASIFVNLTCAEEEHTLRMLEAMACGCPVVSVKTLTAANFVKDSENGYITNNLNDLVKGCQNILKDPNLQTILGTKAVEYVQQYNKPVLLQKFNDLVNKTYSEYLI